MIVPYYKRAPYLHNTLLSFRHFYKDRNDYEVVIVEDIKNRNNPEEHEQLDKVINSFPDINIMWLVNGHKKIRNPCIHFNAGVKKCNGEYLLITNPECLHEVDILSGLDEIHKQDRMYVVCGCKNMDTNLDYPESYQDVTFNAPTIKKDRKDRAILWYQHSKSRNRMLHFCTSISKKEYMNIGGFDEAYAGGVAYDDDDFIKTVQYNKLNIVCRDDLVVVHQHHPDVFRPDTPALININKILFTNKWKELPL